MTRRSKIAKIVPIVNPSWLPFRVCSNDHAQLTGMPYIFFFKIKNCLMMIFSLVAMTGLEKCCITSTYLQWLCHSGERPVARGPPVSLLMYIIITIYGCVKKSVMPLFIFWIIFFIRFGTKLYRQTIGIPMGTNCALLVADLFLFCYERDFMKSLSRENQADIIEAFNSTSRYLDDLLNIDNIYFDQMVDRIYPTELQLDRANSSDTEAPFLDLNLCIPG